MKKRILINFDCMWAWWKPEHFLRYFPYLDQYYEFRVSDDPDVVVYSVYGIAKLFSKRAIRIVISGEAGDHLHYARTSENTIDPDFFQYGLTTFRDNVEPNHRYMPTFYSHLMFHNRGLECLLRHQHEAVSPKREFFCNFVYSNPTCEPRIAFHDRLAKYKPIMCPGRVRHNFDGVDNSRPESAYVAKRSFQRRCKFSIAYENTYPPDSRCPGYITEKLVDPFVARSIPIYRGTIVAGEFFNPKAFIHVDRFPSEENAIAHIVAVDEQDELFMEYLREPVFHDNKVPKAFADAVYLDFFHRIFNEIRRTPLVRIRDLGDSRQSPFPFSNLNDLASARWSIRSAAFPKLYLRVDGRGINVGQSSGAGTVNCQYGEPGDWESFRIESHNDDEFSIVSLAFPKVCLRMDGSGITNFSASGNGVVNCQRGNGAWEQFRFEPYDHGTFAIASVAFPNVYLRMDGSGISRSQTSGVGAVNCQFGASRWEAFHLERV